MNKTIIICLWVLFLCTNMLQAKIYNVKDFGAVGDGQHIDSEAINQAIVQAAREGGGTIYIPAGEYACYSIRLANQIHLYLEQGATVVAAFPTAEQGYDKAEPNPHNSFQDFGHSHWKIPLSGELTCKILQSVVLEKLTEKD